MKPKKPAIPPRPTMYQLLHHKPDGVQDKWSMPFLDDYVAPALISTAERRLKVKLRRMRTMARASSQLMKLNRELRAKLADKVTRTLDPECFPHVPTEVTRQQVATLAAGGLNNKQIATWLGLATPGIVSERYADELEIGRTSLTKNVLATYLSAATNIKHPAMEKAARKYLETHVPGWKEVKQTEIKNVSAENQRPTIDVRALDPEEREVFKALLEKMSAAQSQMLSQEAEPPPLLNPPE